ncbi:Helix-turn-helix domain of resolvase [Pirellulimonas nuda]|uniref:Helix-turn-helix domain of resolvase n=1 Tax=Pirellulimonas nuda TaxID=2528009 RepID=A0A518DJ60_9BACT|nr:helix-turn-helix domain-containing protein [Pirellulimonas nuda]QDU91524.1 Helix-turn-helix domain of resolvase [Pirellulimonas nuda]
MDSEKGRPRALTPEKQERLIELAARGMSVGQAARRVGCSAKTVQRERRRSPLFDYLLGKARSGGPGRAPTLADRRGARGLGRSNRVGRWLRRVAAGGRSAP